MHTSAISCLQAVLSTAVLNHEYAAPNLSRSRWMLHSSMISHASLVTGQSSLSPWHAVCVGGVKEKFLCCCPGAPWPACEAGQKTVERHQAHSWHRPWLVCLIDCCVVCRGPPARIPFLASWFSLPGSQARPEAAEEVASSFKAQALTGLLDRLMVALCAGVLR